MLTKIPTLRQITASQTKPAATSGQTTKTPHPNGKNSPIFSTPAVRTYSTPDPVEKLSVEEVLFFSAIFVCFATPLVAFIWAAAAGVGFLGCLAAAFGVFLGALFVTMSVLALVAVLLLNLREIFTLACVVFFFWLLLLAVRFFAN